MSDTKRKSFYYSFISHLDHFFTQSKLHQTSPNFHFKVGVNKFFFLFKIFSLYLREEVYLISQGPDFVVAKHPVFTL